MGAPPEVMDYASDGRLITRWRTPTAADAKAGVGRAPISREAFFIACRRRTDAGACATRVVECVRVLGCVRERALGAGRASARASMSQMEGGRAARRLLSRLSFLS